MIVSRTPFRLSFVGGGTDLKAFYDIEAGAVIGCTISKYVYVTVNQPLNDTIRVSYWKTEEVDSVDKVEHAIIRETLKYVGLDSRIDVVSVSDIPPGTGLGSSGSFTVGLLNALYAYKSQYVTSDRLASEACTMEIDILGAPIGKQDQYLAAYGGFQYIQFNPDGTVYAEPIICTRSTVKEIEGNLMLFYTGKARDANAILARQQAETREPSRFELLRKIKALTVDVRRILSEGKDLNRFGEVLNEEWQHKKQLAAGISNPMIDEYYDKALKSGAIGGKIAGAGGGGFLLLYCEKDKQPGVIEALPELQPVEFSFVSQGTAIISIS